MKLQEISKPNTVEALNENLSKKFGQTIKVDAFTLEQLQDARNKIRTKLSQFETNESYDSVLKDSDYQKNKLFLDVLNTAIAEREELEEKGSKPDYLDFDKDGDKKEPMKKALKDKKKKGPPVKEGDGIYHDCAKSFKHPKLGECKCIPGQHTLLEDGTVTHYDVRIVRNGKRYIVRDVPIAEATDIVSEGHKHASKKTKSRKMKEDMGIDVFREIEGINDVYDELEQLNREKMGGRISEQLDNMKQHIEGMYRLLDKHDPQMEGISPVPKNGKCPKNYELSADGKSCVRKKGGHAKRYDEGKQILENYFKHLLEGEEDKAEIVMAAKDMVDRVTSWMEDTAEMQAESMLELGDAIRDEMGQAQSETYIQTVKPALESLYQSLEATRASLTSGVAKLTGEEEPAVDMGAEAPGMAAEPGMDAEEPMAEPEDDFGAAEPAAGGEEEAGRAKRESIQRSVRLGQILSSKKK